MGKANRTAKSGETKTLARPLDMLIFLLPLIVFYEFAMLTHRASLASPDRVIAFDLMWRFFALFGQVGFWTPALAVIAILIATHAASGQPWSVNWRRVATMYPESLVLALPLLLMIWTVPLSVGQGGTPLFDRIALGVGAGIYEELVFRLILISVILMIGSDLLHYDRKNVVLFAVGLSSLLFAAHHHRPFGADSFDIVRFVFRTAAGVYLAAIFWYRGYALAAGCHAAYNVCLTLLGVFLVRLPGA
jgi:CAAX prenyl protease-like protein